MMIHKRFFFIISMIVNIQVTYSFYSKEKDRSPELREKLAAQYQDIMNVLLEYFPREVASMIHEYQTNFFLKFYYFNNIFYIYMTMFFGIYKKISRNMENNNHIFRLRHVIENNNELIIMYNDYEKKFIVYSRTCHKRYKEIAVDVKIIKQVCNKNFDHCLELFAFNDYYFGIICNGNLYYKLISITKLNDNKTTYIKCLRNRMADLFYPIIKKDNIFILQQSQFNSLLMTVIDVLKRTIYMFRIPCERSISCNLFSGHEENDDTIVYHLIGNDYNKLIVVCVNDNICNYYIVDCYYSCAKSLDSPLAGYQLPHYENDAYKEDNRITHELYFNYNKLKNLSDPIIKIHTIGALPFNYFQFMN